MDLGTATKIVEDYVARMSCDLGLVVFTHQTSEHDFGWVFFYGPADPSILVGGNAPFIVDRGDGSIHTAGTAHPIETYVINYARVRRAYPFAEPEYIVVLEAWDSEKPGVLKVSLTSLIQRSTSNGLADAKHFTDEILAGRDVVLSFASNAEADKFSREALSVGASIRRETRWH